MAVADVALIDVKQWLRRILQSLVDVLELLLRHHARVSEVYVVLVAVIIDIDLLMVLWGEVQCLSQRSRGIESLV